MKMVNADMCLQSNPVKSKNCAVCEACAILELRVA